MTVSRFILTCLAAFCLLGRAQPVHAVTLNLPPAAELQIETRDDPGTYDMPVGPWSDGIVPRESLDGPVTRQVWRIGDSGLTALDVMRPLREQLEIAGYEVIYECEARLCGGFDFRFAADLLPAPEMYVDLGDYRYVAASRDEGETTDHVSLFASRSSNAGFVQITRVGLSEGAETITAAEPIPTPSFDTQTIGQRIEAEGRVILSDLNFGTGATQLGQGSFPSLVALAEYLLANPTRRIALVGHTDAQGPLDTNIALSKRRAESVLERLVQDHGAARSQLAAEGMGYLAPVASNLTQAGRMANRRVEAIIISTQ